MIRRKNSRQREVIAESIQDLRTHPTAYEVYEIVRKRLPKVSLATVYRNLEALADEGVVKRLDVESGKRRYDPVQDIHCHCVCVQCGKIEDISHAFEARCVVGGSHKSGYKIIDQQVVLKGYCPLCKPGE